MASNWMFALVAGVSVMTAACQPHDLDDAPTVKPPKPQALEREFDRIDERVARHQARWKARKQQLASAAER